MAKTHLPGNDSAQAILDQANDACRRATSLSNQLLTFAKGGAPVRRLVAMDAILRSAVDLVSAGSPAAFTLRVGEDLWPANIDPDQIHQALHNILLNAREAVSEGGHIDIHADNFVLIVDAGTRKAGKYVRISIRDDGRGIPPEILPKIFDPYFTTKPAGSGLGLATAYAIISRHDGHIAVESAPDVRTQFTVDLPALPAAAVEPEVGDETIYTGSGRILAMDDNETLRLLLAQMLERLGYEATCARDGVEALGLFEEARAAGRPFSAVLLDLTVPGGMGGVPTAARLHEIDPSVKLIVSSGYSDAPVMSDYRHYGIDAIIPKPWSLPVLSRTIKQVLT